MNIFYSVLMVSHIKSQVTVTNQRKEKKEREYESVRGA